MTYDKPYNSTFIAARNIRTGFEEIYLSVYDAAQSLNLRPITVYNVLRGKTKRSDWVFTTVEMRAAIDAWKKLNGKAAS